MDSSEKIPKIAFVFADLSYGGSNLQTVKIIQHSSAMNNCIVITLTDVEDEKILENKLKDIGIEPIHMRFNRYSFFSDISRLRKVVAENNCQLVSSNGLRSDMACHYAFRKTNVPHVIVLHNYLREDAFLRMSKPKAILATMLQTRVLRDSKYVVACSKTLKKQTEEDIKGLKVTAIQNGVDPKDYPVLDKLELRRQYGFPNDALIFISTGSMTLRKRIPETVDAFIRANIPNAYLLMVGNGPYLEEYKKKYANSQAVTFLGRRSDIKELLNIADVFVSSSESEGLPLAVLEAMSTGNYLCLSDIPQHQEILQEFGNSGVLYQLGDENELAALFRNTKELLEKSECIGLQNSVFDISVMGRAYRDYYMSVLKMPIGKQK